MNESAAPIREFELTMKLANNLIRARRRELGMTVEQLATAAGITTSYVYGYESLRIQPFCPARGDWRRSALRLAAYFGLAASDLWPESVREIAQSKVVAEVDAATVRKLSGVERRVLAHHERLRLELPAPGESHEQRETVAELMRIADQSLKPVQREVLLRVVLGEESVNDVAQERGITPSRIRQHLDSAIWRLREAWKKAHPDVPLPPTPGDWKRRKKEREEGVEQRERIRKSRLRAERNKLRRQRRILALTPEQRAELDRRALDRRWIKQTDRLIDVWIQNNVHYRLRHGSATDNFQTLTRKLVAGTFAEARKYLLTKTPLTIDGWWFLRRVAMKFGTEDERKVFLAFKRPDGTGVRPENCWRYDTIRDDL